MISPNGLVTDYTYDDHKNVIKTETTNADGSLALQVGSDYDERNCKPHHLDELSGGLDHHLVVRNNLC